MKAEYLQRKYFQIEVWERLNGDGSVEYFPYVTQKYKWLIFTLSKNYQVSKDPILFDGGGFLPSDSCKSLERAKEAAEEAISRKINFEIRNKVIHYKKVYP